MKLSKFVSNSTGVTLLEILIVTAIIGVGAELVAYNVISQMPKYRVEGAARRVALDIMEARAMAINQSLNVAVNFRTDARLYDIWADVNFDNVQDDGEWKTQDISADFPGVTVDVLLGPRFNPQGFATANTTITVSTGGASDPLEKLVKVSLAGTVQIE